MPQNLGLRAISISAAMLTVISAQTLSLSPTSVTFQVGPGANGSGTQTIAVKSPGFWFAQVPYDSAPWVYASPIFGFGDATLTIGLRTTSLTTTTSTNITVLSTSGTQTLPVTASYVAAPEPVPTPTPTPSPAPSPTPSPGPISSLFSYFSGPNYCSSFVNLPDLALCTVPDERTFIPPPAGQIYNDPNFGAPVRIVSDGPAVHGYSGNSAFSAHNKYVLITRQDTYESQILDPFTRQWVASPPIIEGYMWDPVDDDALYFVSRTAIVKYTVSTRSTSVIFDFATAPYPNTVTSSLSTGGSNDMSGDRWFALYSADEKKACVFDINRLRPFCASYAQGFDGIAIRPDAAMMAKGVDRETGKRYALFTSYPAAAIFSVDEASGTLKFEYTGPEIAHFGGNDNGICEAGEGCINGDHFDTFQDANGSQFFVGALDRANPYREEIVSLKFNKGYRATFPEAEGGGLHTMMKLWGSGDGSRWVDWHVGCSKTQPFCVFTTANYQWLGYHDPADPNPTPIGPHVGEVIAIKGNGDEIRRLMKHRAIPYAPGVYWSFDPRTCISQDGKYVLGDSNFGVVNGPIRVFVTETGF